MMRTLGNSPAALNAYLGFSTGLSHTSIKGKLRELIALAVAGENGCDYCNAAHTYLSEKIGIDAQAIQDARLGVSSDVRVNAALVFAKEVLGTRGAVSDDALAEIRAAGYTEGEIIEIIAQVSLSIFTNYVNIAAATEIDFPVQPPIVAHAH